MAKLVRNAVRCKGCDRVFESSRRGETVEHKCRKNRKIIFTIGGGLDSVKRTIKNGTAADNYTELTS